MSCAARSKSVNHLLRGRGGHVLARQGYVGVLGGGVEERECAVTALPLLHPSAQHTHIALPCKYMPPLPRSLLPRALSPPPRELAECCDSQAASQAAACPPPLHLRACEHPLAAPTCLPVSLLGVSSSHPQRS